MSDKKANEKWYEVVSYFNSDDAVLITHDGNQIYICGEVEGVTVIQVSEVYGNEQANIARIKGAQKVMEHMGIQKGIIVTDAVKFVKLREVENQDLIDKMNSDKVESIH